MSRIDEQLKNMKRLIMKEGVSDDDLTYYEVKCRDQEGMIKDLLEYIGKLGNQGHGFSIVVDPKSDDEKSFYWDGDGDGADYLKSVEITKERKKEKHL